MSSPQEHLHYENDNFYKTNFHKLQESFNLNLYSQAISPWDLGQRHHKRFNHYEKYTDMKKNFSQRKRQIQLVSMDNLNFIKNTISKQNKVFNPIKFHKQKQKLQEQEQKINLSLKQRKIQFSQGKIDTIKNNSFCKIVQSRKASQNSHNFLTRNSFFSKFQTKTRNKFYSKTVQQVPDPYSELGKQIPNTFVIKAYDVKKSSFSSTQPSKNSISNQISIIHQNNQKQRSTPNKLRRKIKNATTMQNYMGYEINMDNKTIDSTKSSSRQTSFEVYRKESRKQNKRYLNGKNKDDNKNISTNQQLSQSIPIQITRRGHLIMKQSSQLVFPQIVNMQNQVKCKEFKKKQRNKIQDKSIIVQSFSKFDLQDQQIKDLKKPSLSRQKLNLIQRLKKLKSKNFIQKSFQQLYPKLSQEGYASYLSRINLLTEEQICQQKGQN